MLPDEMTLCLMLERGADPRDGPKLHKRMIGRPALTWLEPPDMTGRAAATSVLAATTAIDHEHLVRAWAGDVWEAWSPHHATVHAWTA